ncbi:universal stress protein [Flagellimonas sp. HMM57]|uniref:hypothetical protein n=1 Tax=unclassified Flagellimonas TaxID=2644544 RepID=UPI0013D72B1D|nr:MULTISPECIES: hypothetical protein [unclassified Flagellimonas]UII77844.1 universal stress protein [Flagellimonas sp. HMM57]
MRKVLIPTDFSARSLKLAEYAFELYSKEIINLILVYPYKMPLFDSELYGFSPNQIITALENEEFSTAKTFLINRFYRNIHSIETALFTGTNSIDFKNFRDEHNIQTAIVPQKGFLDFSRSTTFDPLHYIQKNIPEAHITDIDKKDRIIPYSNGTMSDFPLYKSLQQQ